MNAILVLNARAGTSLDETRAPSPAELQQALARNGISVDLRTVATGEIEASLRQAVADRPEAVIAAGGDGTISAAAAHLAGTGLPLGVLPLGTLNHFARDLGLPLDWREAARALAAAAPRNVDVAEVNGRVFINNCSIGSYGEAVRRRDALRRQRGHGKWRAMAIASWRVFWNLRRLRFVVETPAGVTTVRSPFAVIANNRYTGHVLDSSLRDRLDDGRLWIYTTRARSHWPLVRLVWQALTRPLDDADGLEVRSTTRATVSLAHGPLHVACDGEPVHLEAPLRFRIRPGALRVLVPPAGFS